MSHVVERHLARPGGTEVKGLVPAGLREGCYRYDGEAKFWWTDLEACRDEEKVSGRSESSGCSS